MENTVKTVAVYTLGCRSNQYDSSAIEATLTGGGIDIVAFDEAADAYVINTCTVTKRTDSQSRQIVRKARRQSPEAIIIVTGCYAQVSPGELEKIEDVDYILGNPQKGELLSYLRRGRVETGAPAEVDTTGEGTPLSLRAAAASGRTRANLKVQDGCNRRCTYCIIPMARGTSRSQPQSEVLSEIDSLVEEGFKEIVLTGIHLGGWGEDLIPKKNFTGLLHEIEKKETPFRVRISSLDPDEATAELAAVMAGAKRICNHLHLPMQSGDDTILKAMARPYSRSDFAATIKMFSSKVPEISIGTDVIVGFPGETDANFENTYALIESLPLSYLHVFPYSKREGTEAANYGSHLAPDVIKERAARLRDLDTKKRLAFNSTLVGKTVTVLVEGPSEKEAGLMKGRSTNYAQVLFKGDPALKNTFVRVSLKEATFDAIWGKIILED